MSHYIQAICFDSGDTIIDEATEIKDEHEVTLRAELIPGADRVLHELKRRGYKLALVADGPVGTFRNTLSQHGLYELFDARAISGEVGVDKPDARMFRCALDQLQIRPDEYGRVMMVGNNLSRDIKGANELGIISVWLDWSPRRSKIPADASEAPRYTIKTPTELLSLIDQLERVAQGMSAAVQQVITTHLQPKIRVDGGDIEFERLDGNTIYLGAYAECATCPASPERLTWWLEQEFARHFGGQYTVVITNHVPYFEQ